MDNSFLEKFYVYRCLGEEEKWGALILDSGLDKLTNVAFGMRVFANNEKAAIGRARDLYEKIHKYDSDKDNIRRFACSALKKMISSSADPKKVARTSMEYAIAMNEVFKAHFENLEETENINATDSSEPALNN